MLSLCCQSDSTLTAKVEIGWATQGMCSGLLLLNKVPFDFSKSIKKEPE